MAAKGKNKVLDVRVVKSKDEPFNQVLYHFSEVEIKNGKVVREKPFIPVSPDLISLRASAQAMMDALEKEVVKLY